VNGDGNEMIAPFGVAVERHQSRRGGGANGGHPNWAECARGQNKGELIYQDSPLT
jgi:hypothetical protein